MTYTVSKTVSGFTSGLSTVGYTLYNPANGAVAVARTTTGVHEIGSTDTYAVAMPGVDGTNYIVLWDDGAGNLAPDVLLDPALSVASGGTYNKPRYVQGFASGLSTVGYTLLNTSTGATAVARTMTGVSEITGTGIYICAMPGAAGVSYTILWDDGAGTSAIDVLSTPPYTVTLPAAANVLSTAAAYGVSGSLISGTYLAVTAQNVVLGTPFGASGAQTGTASPSGGVGNLNVAITNPNGTGGPVRIITWLAVTGNVNGYDIKRSMDGGATSTRIGHVAAGVTTFTDTTRPLTGSAIYDVDML